jgi:serine/threonine protein kinase
LLAIGGIVAGVVALFVCLGVVSLLIIILKRKKKKRRKLSFQHHNIGNDESSVSKNDIDLDLTSVVTARKSRIHFQELVVEREIGVGSYGKVWLGKWNHAPVALKFCKERNGINDIFSEIKVLLELPPHPNVVQMYGISCNSAQLVIVLEYCAGGSLDKLLFENDNLMQDNDMIALVKGIATGILHLHKHNIIHRDLAARNVLLTASGEPKISDFGMSRIIERAEGRTNSQVGPIRWMAPESLSNKIYSKKSDIWMLGIVVYEIVARAEPHVDVDPVDVGVLIRDQGLTPEIPSHTPPVLREIMQSCWKQNPDDRPVSTTSILIFSSLQQYFLQTL